MLTYMAIRPVTSKGNYSDRKKDKEVTKKKGSASQRKSDDSERNLVFIDEKPGFDFAV